MNLGHKKIESYRAAMTGLLFVFAFGILLELINSIYFGVALAAIALGVILSKFTSRHFSHNHNHPGDSAIDAIPVVVLLFANILHPAIDGFSAVETFKIGGTLAGLLYAGSIVLHELLRQSAFITALAPLRINWRWVVLTATLGILAGVATALGEAKFFSRYEIAADLATLFSYSFVISEFYFSENAHNLRNSKKLFFLGLVAGLVLVLLMK